jgi:hypothetical protein
VSAWSFRPVVLACASLVMLLTALPAFSEPVAAGREYDVKAGFIFNFLRLVDFPEEAFTSPSDDLRIEVIGHDSFDGALDRLIAGKKINQHRVVISYADNPSTARRAHLVFVSRSAQKLLPDILATLKSVPVLTVSDIDQFAERGGMIGLATEQGMVRFAINRGAAAQGRLRVDSRLLSLAKLVSSASLE